MREFFLGKPWHWLLIAVVAALTWWTGEAKLHVIHFNLFITALFVGSIVVVLLIVRTTKPGEQVTREPLTDSELHEDTDPQ